MFNWVCPRCGRENSPAYTECPDCKERDLQAAAEAGAVAPQPVPVEYYQSPPQAPPQPLSHTQEWQAPYQPPQQPQPPIYNPPPQYVQAPPQYAPQQAPTQYGEPPQYAPQQYAQPPQQQQPPQYAQPPQQQPPQYAPPPQQPQYPPQQPQYNQTQPIYVQQPPQQYAPPQQPQYAPPPQQPQYAPPPQPKYTPPAPAPAPAPVAQPKPKPAYVPPSTPLPAEKPEPGFVAKLGALPTPLLMLLFAVIFLLVGAAIYYGYQRFGKGGAGSTAGVQATASTKPKATNPIQKYIEVVGIRLTTDPKKNPIAKFVIVNHASTELNNLGAIVTLWASTSRSEEDAVGSFTFNVENIGPYQSKEVSAPFKTKLKIYELPDWQNATPEVQITSPQQ